MKRALAFAILVILARALPATAQQSPGTPVCYALDLGDWRPQLPAGDAPYHTPPPVVALLDSIGSEVFEQGKRLLRPVIPHGRTPRAFWEAIGPDSLLLLWTSGFAGVRIRLGTDGGVLRGTAEAFTDDRGRPEPVTSVVARRADCTLGAGARF